MREPKKRASLGFGNELDAFDPKSWTTSSEAPAARPSPDEARRVAEAAGFRSREPLPPPISDPLPKPRRRRTGRNVQFNIKTKADTIEAFCQVADANGWGLGETFEIATELLSKHHGASGS